jgi:hypothetical protein
MGADVEAELRGIGRDERVNAIRRDGFVEPTAAVVADRPKEGAGLLSTMPGGLEVIVNESDGAASRCRIVAPSGVLLLVAKPISRRSRSSRQAMTCAGVTVRNSSGRAIPAKRMKSLIAFW